MDARERGVRQVGGDEATTTKIGAVALPLAVPVLVVAEIFHPTKEDPMDNLADFREYAQSDIWTTVHLTQYFAFSSCSAAWSPSTTPLVPNLGRVQDLHPSASPRR
jgi:hypothetical protein